MCCFGVNYNVVTCKALFQGSDLLSAVNLHCNYNKMVNIYLLLRDKMKLNTTTDFVNRFLVGA